MTSIKQELKDQLFDLLNSTDKSHLTAYQIYNLMIADEQLAKVFDKLGDLDQADSIRVALL